jgi:predicted TPR repeat methyltransferase
VVQLRPEWAGGWLALGNANARAGRKAAAVAAFTAYLARAPRSDAATVERIRALVEQLRT